MISMSFMQSNWLQLLNYLYQTSLNYFKVLFSHCEKFISQFLRQYIISCYMKGGSGGLQT